MVVVPLACLLVVASCGEPQTSQPARTLPGDRSTDTSASRDRLIFESEYRAQYGVEALILSLDPGYNGVSSWGCVMPGPATPIGRILAADGGANVYVTSLGEEDGVVVGQRLGVWRDDQFIAHIELSDVQAKKSAGGVVGETPAFGIRRNDKLERAE